MSGGYADDRDEGDVIIYTGQGGRDPNTGLQIDGQLLTRGNKQLAKHFNEGNPIRVSRGSQLGPPHGPAAGYRYDGLYRIDDFWHVQGRDGFLVYRFRLVKIHPNEKVVVSTAPTANSLPSVPVGTQEPKRLWSIRSG